MDKPERIHATYILSILVGIIIVLATVKWTEIPGLLERLSFALTVSALILAVLAIIQNLYSSASLADNVSKLNAASDLIKGNASNLEQVTLAVVARVEAIPPLISVVGEKVDATQDLVKQLGRVRK